MQHEELLRFFAGYIEAELGIIYAEHNFFQLENRLQEIAKLLDVESLGLLYARAQKEISGSFKQLLLDTATNNETSFFRDPKIFRAIENVFQKLTANNPGRPPISIWSAGCSTGQEALSLAMVAREFSEKTKAFFDFSITCSDISERALDRAQKGVYSQLEVQRGLPAPYLVKYFENSGTDTWSAKPVLTQKISFKKLNLKEPFNFDKKFDLILCRNVLIYQNVAGKREIIRRMTNELTTGGHLILGSGESMLGLSDDFEQQNVDGAIIYRKKDENKNAA